MDGFTNLDLLIYSLVVASTSVFSGIAGGGGGFISTPLLIFLGLSPAQAVASGKFGGLFVSLGSIHGMKNVKRTARSKQLIFLAIAFIAGVASPFVIKSLDSEIYKDVLGIIIILMIPIMIKKKVGHFESKPSELKQAAGYPLLMLAFIVQGIFSGGLGTLVLIIMMYFFGMNALTANLTKRTTQLLLNLTVIVGVIASGLVVWKVAAVGSVIGMIGGSIGGRIATKKGEKFVMNVLLILMLVSGAALIIA